jgi:hypothetical protein
MVEMSVLIAQTFLWLLVAVAVPVACFLLGVQFMKLFGLID